MLKSSNAVQPGLAHISSSKCISPVSLFLFPTAFFGSLALTIMKFRRYQCSNQDYQNTNAEGTSYADSGGGGGASARIGADGYDIQRDCLSGIGGFQLDIQVSEIFYAARTFQSSWSFYLGWLGIFGCMCSSACVFILSKLMRNGPYFAS